MNIFRVFTFASLLITVVVLLFTSMPYWFGKTELPSYLRGVLQNNSSSAFVKENVLDKPLIPAKTKIRHVQLATTWDPSFVDEPSIYRFTYGIINAFLNDSVPIFLAYGSVIGARRHHGVIPFDKDVDFSLFCTNTTYIENVLDTLNIKWSYNTDGKGPGNTGFGYHLYTPFKQYMDIWLFDYVDNGDKVTCVGVRNGCKRWFAKYLPSSHRQYKPEIFFPPTFAPFGPYLMPIPHKSTEYLELRYGKTWKTMCGGWSRGNTPCSTFKKKYAFVKELEGREELYLDNKLIQTFLKKNDVYTYQPDDQPEVYTWADCKLGSSNRSQDLYEQMMCVTKSLEDLSYTHVICAGSLIGLQRSRTMNPYEVDNDICMKKDVDWSLIAKRVKQCDMIIFHYGIWRGCTKGLRRRSAKAPWNGQYLPYTDFYDLGHFPFWLDTPISLDNKWYIQKYALGDSYVYAPDNETSLKILNAKYGSMWRNPPQKKKYNQGKAF